MVIDDSFLEPCSIVASRKGVWRDMVRRPRLGFAVYGCRSACYPLSVPALRSSLQSGGLLNIAFCTFGKIGVVFRF